MKSKFKPEQDFAFKPTKKVKKFVIPLFSDTEYSATVVNNTQTPLPDDNYSDDFVYHAINDSIEAPRVDAGSPICTQLMDDANHTLLIFNSTKTKTLENTINEISQIKHITVDHTPQYAFENDGILIKLLRHYIPFHLPADYLTDIKSIDLINENDNKKFINQNRCVRIYHEPSEEYLYLDRIILNLGFFWSIKDLEYTLGKNLTQELLVAKRNGSTLLKTTPIVKFNDQNAPADTMRLVKISYKTQRKPVYLSIYLKIDDFSGLCGKMSLKETARTLGIPMTLKDDLDKTNMLGELHSNPERFIDYALDDVRVLTQIKDKYQENINILRNVIGVKPIEKINQLTIGSNIASMLHDWFIPEHLIKPMSTLSDEYDPDVVYTHSNTKSLANSLLENAGVKQNSQKTTTHAHIAVVQGGRCTNEDPDNMVVHNGMDIDISGAYSNAISKLEYPIGLPYIFGQPKKQKQRKTLKQFLTKHKNQLDHTNWVMVVSGETSFDFDLIMSKDTSITKINKQVRIKQTYFTEITEIKKNNDVQGHFTRQVKNGIITHDILKAIQHIATATELKEINNFKIVAAMYYRQSDYIPDNNEWANTISNRTFKSNKAGLMPDVYQASNGKYVDNRPRAWTTRRMTDLITPIQEMRTHYKSQLNEVQLNEVQLSSYQNGIETRSDKGSIEATLFELQAKSDWFKLAINTIYGVLASPFFLTSNVCLANNITAKVRLQSWQMAKALNLKQIITDGGIYSLDKVMYFEGQLPGFNSLANILKWNDTNSSTHKRYCAPLTKDSTGFNTDVDSRTDWDSIAQQHLINFWKPYDLEIDFKVEHKQKNSFSVGVYYNKSDYLLKTHSGETVIRSRGNKHLHNDDPNQVNGKISLLKFIANNSDKLATTSIDKALMLEFTMPKVFTEFSLLNVRDYRTLKIHDHSFKGMPHDAYQHTRKNTFSTTHQKYKTLKEYYIAQRQTKKTEIRFANIIAKID